MIHTSTLRKLGDSTVIDIPPTFLESLHCTVGDEMELRLKGNRLEIRPKKQRLSLDDRLAMYRAALVHRTQEEATEDSAWDAAPAVGREA